MSSVNKVMILGRLTRDVELKYLQSGTALAEVGVAVDHRYKGKDGEWQSKPVFVDVTLWARTAEIASEYLGKGSQVHIEGRLDLDQWEDKETGKKRSKLKVVGEKLTMVGKKGEGGGSRSEYAEPIKDKPAERDPGEEGDEGSDVPF